MHLARSIFFLLLCGGIADSYAEVYKWVDAEGNVHFSDKKPVEDTPLEVVPLNIIENSKSEIVPKRKDDTFNKDDFRMPNIKSRIPFRFVLTSALDEKNEPKDRLSSINIGTGQKSFYLWVKLTGVESDKPYVIRVRVLDAKGELMFDNEKKLQVKSNSILVGIQISPSIHVDAPGSWTFQGILDNRKLFVEKRDINFRPSPEDVYLKEMHGPDLPGSPE